MEYTLIMRAYITVLFIISFSIVSGFGQNNGTVTGKTVDIQTKETLTDVRVKVAEEPLIEMFSQSDGSFSIELPLGKDYTFVFSKEGYESFFIKIKINEDETDIGTIMMTDLSGIFQDIPTMLLLDSEDDSDFSSQNIISLGAGGQDVYVSESAFKFGAVRFYIRGFDNEYNQTYINGVSFNDQIRGRFNYSMLGGLNDVTRNKDIAINTTPSSFGFGDLGGVTNINTRAASYGNGGRITGSATNRNYKLRGIGTYSTGLMSNGWAFTASMGYRWADEGYFEGTFYNSLGYLFAVERVFGDNKQHNLSLTTIGAPTQRGQVAASYQEIYDMLDNTRYNPNWGYQNGVKRNSRVVTANDPMVVISHKWLISNKIQLTTGIGTRYSQYGVTALNWYESADPRPDYYRYLPSYYNDTLKIKFEDNTDLKDKYTYPEVVELYTKKWKNDKSVSQIDWNRLYEVNYFSREKGESARFILEERHSNLLEYVFNSLLKYNISDRQILEVGVEAKNTKAMYFKTVNDLLGADYWKDVDVFAERDFRSDLDIKQNDIDNPDRKVKKGDIFGYNYNMHVNSANLWIQNRFFFPQTELYYAAKISYTEFQREGLMKNGRAPNNSLGKGELHYFVDQAIKGGFTYKITGSHLITANLLYQTKAPYPWNAYLSSRIKDDTAPNLCSERVASMDLGYLFSTQYLRGRITVYQANFFDQSEINSFFHDYYNTFVNYVMTGIEKVHRGVEFGIIMNATKRLKLELVGTIAEYRYNNRPTGHATYENGSQPTTTETVYFKNYYVGGTPQTVGSIGFSYALPKYWFLNANYSIYDRIYIDPSPVRRTEIAANYPAGSLKELEEKVASIIEQEMLPSGGTLDFSLGKSLRLKNGYFLNFNLSVTNILDNTELKTGGFEQGRFDYQNFDMDRFPSKYYNAQGRTYFLNVGLRF